MEICKIYDNGGKTIDRYTILTEPFYFGKSCEALGLSDDCDSPQGFSQWSEAFDGEHLGKEVRFDELPQNVQDHIIRRLTVETERNL